MPRGKTAEHGCVVRIDIGIKNIGGITERTFFHRHFLRELLGFSRLAHFLSDPSKYLHLTIGHTALHNSVVRPKIVI